MYKYSVSHQVIAVIHWRCGCSAPSPTTEPQERRCNDAHCCTWAVVECAIRLFKSRPHCFDSTGGDAPVSSWQGVLHCVNRLWRKWCETISYRSTTCSGHTLLVRSGSPLHLHLLWFFLGHLRCSCLGRHHMLPLHIFFLLLFMPEDNGPNEIFFLTSTSERRVSRKCNFSFSACFCHFLCLSERVSHVCSLSLSYSDRSLWGRRQGGVLCSSTCALFQVDLRCTKKMCADFHVYKV